MSFQEIGLGKLLKSMIVPAPERRRMLREDVGYVLGKLAGSASESGGDFYGPFWADAKRHVAGDLDLRQATEERIAANKVSRQRLYPQLNDGFLGWWEQKRRQRNESFRVIEGIVKARYPVPGLGIVKVDNTMAITVGLNGHRIIYPYFYLDVALTEEAARIGLWVMSQCVKGYDLQDMRVLDVFRGRSFSIIDTPLASNEEAQMARRYAALLDQWQEIRNEMA